MFFKKSIMKRMGIIETNLKMGAMEIIKENQAKIPELGSMKGS